MADNTVQLEARKWIDSLDNKWRLQILAKKFKLNLKTGERKEYPVRIRRFAEGIPWAYVAESIKYLLSLAPYKGVIFNGVELPDEYRPTLTTWNRDDQSTVNGQGRTDGTYTLIQDLLVVDEEDSYTSGTGASCSEEVVTEWHWDEADVMELPQPRQGVTYAIQQVNRKEDGTFDYALVKRTAITQHSGRTVVRDSAVEHVETDTWNNVYTDDEGRYVDNTGALLDIPQAGPDGDGALVEISKRENDDCTFSIQATWTLAKPALAKGSSTINQFSARASEEHVGETEPLPLAPEEHDGFIWDHSNQLQPDGKFSTVKTVTRERPVTDQTVSVTVGRRGRRVEHVDVNQPEPAPTSGLAIGQSVKVEKTPGKLYNNTRVNFDVTEHTPVGESCEIDQYKHDHSETIAGVDEIPGIDEHVEGSGVNGDVKRRTTQMDDEGSISQTNSVHHEREVLKSTEGWTVGLRGVQHTYTDTQTGAPLPKPSLSRENIGKSVRNEKTPGGLFNVTVSETDRDGSPMDTGEGCAKTVFEHRDTTSALDPSGEFSGHVPDAGDGKYYENQSRLNDDGTSTNELTEHRELPVEASDVTYKRTAKAVYTQRTDRNVFREAEPPDHIGTSSHSTNPGGTHNVTESSVVVLGGADRSHCDQTVFLHQHDEMTSAVGTEPDKTDTPPAGGGRYYDKSSQVDDEGLVTTVLRTSRELPVDRAEVTYRKTAKAVYISRTDRNTNRSAEVPEKLGSSSHKTNPGGTRDVTVTTVEITGGTDRAHCKQTVFLHSHDDVTVGDTLDQTDAPAAGGGRYYEKTGTVDENGVATTVLETNTEQEVEDALVRYENTALVRTEVRTSKNTLSTAQPVGVSENKIVSQEHTTNPGGSRDLTVTTKTAVPVRWKAEADTSHLYMYVVGFANQKAENLQGIVDEVAGKINAKAAGASGGSAAIPTVSVRPVVDYNQFGTLDGRVTGTIEWPADSDGQDGVWQKMDWRLFFTMVSTTVQFYEHGKVVSRGEKFGFWASGYGLRTLASIWPRKVLNGSSAHVANRATQAWNVTVLRRESLWQNGTKIEEYGAYDE